MTNRRTRGYEWLIDNGYVQHKLPVRPEAPFVTLIVPEDLTIAEADRLCDMIRALALT